MTKSILIVEDDLRAAKTAEDFFSANNYNVSVAHDLKEALEFLENHTFDYVITDTFYPQETGTDKREHLQYLVDSVREKVEYGIEEGELHSTSLPETLTGLESWLKGDEKDQPLGLFLVKVLLENYEFSTEQIVFTTNLNHHAKTFEPIHCLRVGSPGFPIAFANIDIVHISKRRKWPVLEECVNNLDGKYQELFWRKVQGWLS